MAGGGAGDGFDRFILKHHKVAGGPTEALELVLNTLEKYVNEIYCLLMLTPCRAPETLRTFR